MNTKRLKAGGIYSVDWIAGDGRGSDLWTAWLQWDGNRWVDVFGDTKNIVATAARLVPLHTLPHTWKVKLAEEAVEDLVENPVGYFQTAAIKRLRKLFKTPKRKAKR